jgi:hypothetical protein
MKKRTITFAKKLVELDDLPITTKKLRIYLVITFNFYSHVINIKNFTMIRQRFGARLRKNISTPQFSTSCSILTSTLNLTHSETCP